MRLKRARELGPESRTPDYPRQMSPFRSLDRLGAVDAAGWILLEHVAFITAVTAVSGSAHHLWNRSERISIHLF